MSAFFVTGTDTEVGKTFVSAALLRAASLNGLTSQGLKPVAAGCETISGALRNDDALTLIDASSGELPYEAVNPIALEPPIAPHIAAAEAGVELSARTLADHCLAQVMADQFTLVEGAGGWLVPLNERETLADLAVLLDLPVILVVGLKLGCINHALLTAQAIIASGLTLAGWVANAVVGEMDRQAPNIETLQHRLPAPHLGTLPRLNDDESAHLAHSHLDLDLLLAAKGTEQM